MSGGSHGDSKLGIAYTTFNRFEQLATSTPTMLIGLRTSFIAISLALGGLAVHAGTLEFDDSDFSRRAHLSGRIETADADQLLQLIRTRPKQIYRLTLDSPGGSVAGALRLAEVVQKMALSVQVRPGRACASACFFVFLAGSGRQASGRELMEDISRRLAIERDLGFKLYGYLGIHRPFDPNLSSPENSQAALMRAVAAYLDKQLLPRRLIDAMMTRPSNDIYWLTAEDVAEIGEYPPHLEEYFIQRCSYDRNRMQRLAEAKRLGDSIKVTQLDAESQRSGDCEIRELSRLREKGESEIRRGWRPAMR